MWNISKSFTTNGVLSNSSGALVTGNGGNAKLAVTAKLPLQDNVNAAVDVAWQIPPFCKYLIAGPRA